MITPAYCVTMAGYNAWQNWQVRSAMQHLSEAALCKPRGGFFGSVQGTVNHLLWGDLMWMARFDGGKAPVQSIAQSPELCADMASWASQRMDTDRRILQWANGLHDDDLAGAYEWYSAAQGKDVVQTKAACITHFFNHQTHHRGQTHEMLTAAGAVLGDTDLVFMPQEGPWL